MSLSHGKRERAALRRWAVNLRGPGGRYACGGRERGRGASWAKLVGDGANTRGMLSGRAKQADAAASSNGAGAR